MCKAISLVSFPTSKDESWVYFHQLHGRVVTDTYENDSHSSIAANAVKECELLAGVLKRKRNYAGASDIINKWEWNPFTNYFRRDMVNCKINDYTVVRDFVKTLTPGDVIGLEGVSDVLVRLEKTHTNSSYYGIFYRKGRSWIRLYRIQLCSTDLPVSLRDSKKVTAIAYRKRGGGWSLKDFKKA